MIFSYIFFFISQKHTRFLRAFSNHQTVLAHTHPHTYSHIHTLIMGWPVGNVNTKTKQTKNNRWWLYQAIAVLIGRAATQSKSYKAEMDCRKDEWTRKSSKQKNAIKHWLISCHSLFAPNCVLVSFVFCRMWELMNLWLSQCTRSLEKERS